MDRVGLNPKLLGVDEYEVVHTRTHAKALVVPVLALVLIGAGAGAGAALLPGDAQPAGGLAIVAVGLVLALSLVLVPFLRWRTTTYTLTNRRLITRSGILNRTGKDLPLSRVNDVSSERSLADRMLGCGTLKVQTAAEGGTVVLPDVPDVEHLHTEMTQLLFGTGPLDQPDRDRWSP